MVASATGVRRDGPGDQRRWRLSRTGALVGGLALVLVLATLTGIQVVRARQRSRGA